MKNLMKIPYKKGDQVCILLPSANNGFDYIIPPEMVLYIGDFVKVTLRGKEEFGIVWDKGIADIPKNKLKYIEDKLNFSLPVLYREFIEWAANYNLSDLGLFLKLIFPKKQYLKDYKKKEIPNYDIKENFSYVELSDEQNAAYQKIKNSLNVFSPILLEGVTGSGKTEVFFKIIADILKANKEKEIKDQVLIILPEIALTQTIIERFKNRFLEYPYIWHSNIKETEKRKIWQEALEGKAEVIIGARSALFLPFKNLKFIVIDEEHDSSYKQEEQVIYNARDMAVLRAKLGRIPVVLSSATPTIETINNVIEGKYEKIELKNRYNNASLPDIKLLDLKENKPQKYTAQNKNSLDNKKEEKENSFVEKKGFLSPVLIDKINDKLNKKEQVLLFLNRRGYAPLAVCSECGHQYFCPNCSVPLVYHQYKHSLECHHCGYIKKIPKICENCNEKNSITLCGPGVERLKEEVKSRFKKAKVKVFSSDTIKNIDDILKTAKEIEDNKIDIIIGTQIFAKGHHFPNITLVGIVDGDLSLLGSDLRASEKTYQLLNQVSGRAGREEKKGEVYIQTFNPENKVLKALVENKIDEFIKLEMEERKLLKMPPFGRLGSLILSSKNEDKLKQEAKRLYSLIPNGSGFEILGPVDAPIYILRNRYRVRFLIRTDKNISIQKVIKQWLKKYKINSSVRIKIDIDPISFM